MYFTLDTSKKPCRVLGMGSKAGWLERIVRAFLEWFCPRFLPVYVIPRDDKKPYLSRYYVLGAGRGDAESSGVPARKWMAWLPVNVFLHHFHSSDASGDLHNHPWGFSISLILTGGYSEERLHRYTCHPFVARVTRRMIRPGMFNVIRAEDYHRADLLDPARGAWTLFFAGKRRQDWGFLNRKTLAFKPWQSVKNIRNGLQND